MPAESFVRYFLTTPEFCALTSLPHTQSFLPHPLARSGMGTFFLVSTLVFVPHSMFCFSVQKEEEEGEKSDAEEPVPEATERKEHDSCGQTGVDSVQSAQAVELAGTAPEKEQGKEVMDRHCLCLSESVFSSTCVTSVCVCCVKDHLPLLERMVVCLFVYAF